jgi:hypothetical protein
LSKIRRRRPDGVSKTDTNELAADHFCLHSFFATESAFLAVLFSFNLLSEFQRVLERFMDALSCIVQCFIADSMLEELPAPSSVGKIKVGGIDLNKVRMRWVVEALIALCVSPSEAQGFTASELARQVRLLSNRPNRSTALGAPPMT